MSCLRLSKRTKSCISRLWQKICVEAKNYVQDWGAKKGKLLTSQCQHEKEKKTLKDLLHTQRELRVRVTTTKKPEERKSVFSACVMRSTESSVNSSWRHHLYHTWSNISYMKNWREAAAVKSQRVGWWRRSDRMKWRRPTALTPFVSVSDQAQVLTRSPGQHGVSHLLCQQLLETSSLCLLAEKQSHDVGRGLPEISVRRISPLYRLWWPWPVNWGTRWRIHLENLEAVIHVFAMILPYRICEGLFYLFESLQNHQTIHSWPDSFPESGQEWIVWLVQHYQTGLLWPENWGCARVEIPHLASLCVAFIFYSFKQLRVFLLPPSPGQFRGHVKLTRIMRKRNVQEKSPFAYFLHYSSKGMFSVVLATALNCHCHSQVEEYTWHASKVSTY